MESLDHDAAMFACESGTCLSEKRGRYTRVMAHV